MNLPVAKFTCLACGRTEYRMSSLGFGELLKGECRCGGDMAITGRGTPQELGGLLELVCKHFEILDFRGTEMGMEAEVESSDPKRSFLSLSDELEPRGYFVIMRKGEGIRIFLAKLPPSRTEKIWVNLLLLVATAGTTLLAGLYLFKTLASAFVFSSSLMVILGAHEAGHRLAAKRNRTEISVPYFIPAPPLLGTFGAVIVAKKPVRTKEAMMEMGFLGPMLGFLLALLALLFGLLQPASVGGVPLPMLPALLLLLTRNPSIQLNPLLLSGSAMLMVTALNLLPAGQLDGGHIFRGITSASQHYKLTRLLGFSLLFTGFIFPYCWAWGLLILLLFNQPHPGALDDLSEVSTKYRKMAAVSLLILLLCLPIPTKL